MKFLRLLHEANAALCIQCFQGLDNLQDLVISCSCCNWNVKASEGEILITAHLSSWSILEHLGASWLPCRTKKLAMSAFKGLRGLVAKHDGNPMAITRHHPLAAWHSSPGIPPQEQILVHPVLCASPGCRSIWKRSRSPQQAFLSTCPCERQHGVQLLRQRIKPIIGTPCLSQQDPPAKSMETLAGRASVPLRFGHV